jgi:DNA-binding MarR family transcriptional regulator
VTSGAAEPSEASVREIEREFQRMPRQLAHLEELGLIQRRPDETDGRGKVAVVAPEAAERIRALQLQTTTADSDKLLYRMLD